MTIEPTVNLTNCHKEPIHIPGLIQPHGVLLILKEPALEIIQVSNNTFKLLGHEAQELLGNPLSNLLDAKQIAAIWQCLSQDFENVNPLNIAIKRQSKSLRFDGIVHRSDSAIVLELEPKKTAKKQTSLSSMGASGGQLPKSKKHRHCQKCAGLWSKKCEK